MKRYPSVTDRMSEAMSMCMPMSMTMAMLMPGPGVGLDARDAVTAGAHTR